jgi:hypothetical protein
MLKQSSKKRWYAEIKKKIAAREQKRLLTPGIEHKSWGQFKVVSNNRVGHKFLIKYFEMKADSQNIFSC